jgi:hypothetical protein
MLHSSNPCSQREQLERLGTGQLFGLFESFSTTKSTAIQSEDLAEAWGILFSKIYLSAEELVQGMQSGEHLLGEDRERVLREFIHADCRSGGVFVLEVIRKGGNFDRSALIMMADLEDLAGVESGTTTALHLLAEACDRNVRPVFIERAGKRVLSELYDSRGLPAIFTIFGLNDLSREDLNAIANVFTRDDLKRVKHKNRTGRSGLEVYSEASRRMKGQAPRERHTVENRHAVKSTNLRGAIRSQIRSATGSGTDVMGESRGTDGADTGRPGARERYDDLITHPLDKFGRIVRRKPKPK